MFEDSLVESSGRLAHRHLWSTAISFAGQILIAGALLLLSLFYTEAHPYAKAGEHSGSAIAAVGRLSGDTRGCAGSTTDKRV